MKKLLILLGILALFIPEIVFATTASGWNFTNISDGFIIPNKVNGTNQGILVSASSTINGNFSVSTLTSGNCVQASTGGLLVSASGACGSGSGSTFSTTSLSAVAPLQYSQSPLAQFSITQAGTGGNGYLSSTDFNTFNNKISSTSLSVTTTGTSGAATYTPSTGVFNIPQYQAGGNYITALTGDVTATGPGSVPATLATVNGNVGTFTYPSVTVNGKGLITAISNGTAPTTYTGTFPILVTGSVISSLFSTTTNSGMSAGNLYVGTGGIFQTSGTSTPTVSAPITYSGTLGQFISGVSGAFGCQTASGSQAGCLSSTDWTTFNNKGNGTITSVTLGGGLDGVTPITTTGTIIAQVGTSTTAITNSVPFWANSNTPSGLSSDAQFSYTNSGVPVLKVGGLEIDGVTSAATGAIGSSTAMWGIKAGGNVLAIFDTTGLSTSNKTFTFPNTTGTLCLTSTCTGTVTSVSGSGGTTGLTLTGGAITTSGTLTLGGTLVIANGGTNQTSFTSNGVTFFNGTSIATNSSSLFSWFDTAAKNTIGTSTPTLGTVTIGSSTVPQLTLVDNSLNSNGFAFRNINGNFYLSTTSATTLATSTNSWFNLLTSGGFSTTTFSYIDTVLKNTSNNVLSILDGFGTQDAAFGTASTTGSIFTVVATTSPNLGAGAIKLFDVDQYGHLTASSTGAMPTVTCSPSGGSMDANSNDDVGGVTTGTLSSSCAVTFAHPYNSIPFIQLTAGASTGFPYVTSRLTTGFTINISSVATGDDIQYTVLQP